ncbi:MAG: thioredoxin-disulfide reductase [Dehalococcoidia bacterium]|nr:thioredoxin-disulfide reductase [Dehalococcoidia bacterium]
MNTDYEVLIVGGGPAGLAAGLYSARARRRTLLLERGIHGGQIATAGPVENYPGFPDGIEGPELAERMLQQAIKFGMEIEYAPVSGIKLEGGLKVLSTDYGEYPAPAVILAGGSDYIKLGVPGEAELTGKGVSYCATCDGAFFKDQEVAVVGGGNSALDEGLFLTKFVSRLTVIHRRDQLRAEKILQERAFAHPKVRFIWDTAAEEVLGRDQVTGLRLRNLKTGLRSDLPCQGLFVYIGHRPNTVYLKDLVELDEQGFIITDAVMGTGVAGLYAAGDIRHDSARQLATAAGDGVTAAIEAEHYLTELAARQGGLTPKALAPGR